MEAPRRISAGSPHSMRSKSGLAKLLNGVRLRPIHVVIPGASGVSYDYSQHRGIWLCSADRARDWRKTSPMRCLNESKGNAKDGPREEQC